MLSIGKRNLRKIVHRTVNFVAVTNGFTTRTAGEGTVASL